MTEANGQRFLVIRNDKLGDFMLAWPAMAHLKQAHPDNHITVLVPAYTEPVARQCPWVDTIMQDPGDGAPRNAQHSLLATLRESHFDASLTLFSTPRIGWLCWRAGIPVRMAPATKWAQIFHNHRLTQRRSRSVRPEFQYNVELANALIEHFGQKPPAAEPPYWPLSTPTRIQQRQQLANELQLDSSAYYVFMHPGTGGSSPNMTPEQYVKLAAGIDADVHDRIQWLVTAGPDEEAIAVDLDAGLRDAGLDASVVAPRNGLEDFALMLSAADLFISAATGPLHIVGCLDLPSIGFYPAKRSARALRWKTCSSPERRMTFSTPSDIEDPTDMTQIDIDEAVRAVTQWWPDIIHGHAKI